MMNSPEQVSADTVADYVVRRVAEQGSTHIFGVGGANIEDVYDAVHRFGPGIRAIVAKHEFGAATMADGYSRTTNRLGVVVATSGGGSLNVLAALGEAFDSGVPLLALIGQAPASLEGCGAFQDTSGRAGTIDAQRLFGQVSRFCAKPASAGEVPGLLERAFVEAADGPSVLLLPKDIQRQAMPPPADGWSLPPRRDTPAPAGCRDRDLRRAEALLAATADGPAVLIAGPEVARAGARAELDAFAGALDAAVLVTPDAKDVFRNGHPLFAGVCGIMGHDGAADLIADAALCVIVGTPMTMTARGGLDEALAGTRILHLGARPPFIDVEVSVTGDLAEHLRALAGAVTPGRSSARGGGPRPLPVPAATGPGVRYSDAVAAVSTRLATGAGIFADAGNTGAAVVHHLAVPEDGRFVVALGMGGMGYAFGGGIGSALGRGRRTFVIAGDGAFFMHGLEVHTAVEYGIPVTFIVFNNNAHAMCVTREQLYYSGSYTFNRFAPARIGDAISVMFPGIVARSAATLAQFERALDDTCAVPGPVFVSVDCDPDEIPPFAPFLKEVGA